MIFTRQLREGVIDLLHAAKHGRGQNAYLVGFRSAAPKRPATRRKP